MCCWKNLAIPTTYQASGPAPLIFWSLWKISLKE